MRPAALLAGLLCCVYLLSYAGAFRVDDEHILAARAQSLALRGQFDEPQVYGNSRARQLSSLGDQATQIEPLQTVLGAAFYRIGIAAGLGGAQALLTLNLYLTALTGVLVYLTVVAIGHPPRVGLWCGLLFGVATIAWPYASTFLRDVPAMAMTSIAFLGWALTLREERRWRWIGPAAIALGLAGGILSKNTVWAAALSLAIAAFVRWFPRGGVLRNRKLILVTSAVVGGAVLVVLLLPGRGPLARFSAAYYLFLLSHFLGSLTPSLLAGLAGPFVSPAKSIFLFSPPLLLAALGAYLGWRSGRHFILPAWLTAFFLALEQALFYRDLWPGTFGWGLRFMLPAVPALVVVGGWSVGFLLTGGLWRRVVLWVLALGGFLVQLAGSWVSWNRVYALWTSRGLNPFDPTGAWNAAWLAIPPQMAMLADPTTWSVAWFRAWQGQENISLLIPLGAIGLLVLCAWGLSRGPGRQGWRSGALSMALVLAALVFPLWPTLAILRADSAFGGDQPAYAEIVDRLRQEARPGDVVVVDPYASPLWAAMINTWASPLPWYSLPIELPGLAAGEIATEPAPEVIDLLQRLVDSSGTLWYIAGGEVPPESLQAKLRWLEIRAERIGEVRLEDAPSIVLRAYRGG